MVLPPPQQVKKRTFGTALIIVVCVVSLLSITVLGYLMTGPVKSMRHYFSSKEKVAERVETYIENLPDIDGVQEWDYVITETMFFTPGEVYITAHGEDHLSAAEVHEVLTEVHDLRKHPRYEFNYEQEYGHGSLQVHLRRETPKDLTMIPVQALMDEINAGASTGSIFLSEPDPLRCESGYDVPSDDVLASGPKLLAPSQECEPIIRRSYFHDPGEEPEQPKMEHYIRLRANPTPEQREALLPVFDVVENVYIGETDNIEGYGEVRVDEVKFTQTNDSFDTLRPDSTRVNAAIEFTQPLLQMEGEEPRMVKFSTYGGDGRRTWRVLITEGELVPVQYEFEDSQVGDLSQQFIELLGS